MKAIVVVALLLSCSCGGETPNSEGGGGVDPAGESAKRGARDPSEGRADSAPASQPDEDTPAAALAAIHDYYAAIRARDYPRAYAFWSGGVESSGQTPADFAAGFAETETTSVDTGLPGRIDPAAGSRYIEIPVAVRATTRAGAEQRFTGTYTLRRSVLDGATAEQRSWRIASAELRPRPAAECAAGRPLGETVEDTVAARVRAFGGRLASVSLAASPELVRRQLRTEYAAHVTPALLASWLEEPSRAPGRLTSSPWPARIDVVEVEELGPGRYRMKGDVIYVTSTELIAGGATERQRVELDVTRDGGWRIAGLRGVVAVRQRPDLPMPPAEPPPAPYAASRPRSQSTTNAA